MRITSVSTAYNSQNLRPQKISFGKFESKETKQYVRENILNPNIYGDSAREAFDYFDKSNLVTIKRKNGLTYAVAERGAIDKHRNKELLENMILLRYRLFKFKPDKKDLTATIDNVFCDFERDLPEFKKEASIVKSEPGYLTTIDDFSEAHNLYEDFRDAETGRNSNSSSSTPLREKYEPDSWDKAHDWMKN